MMLIPLKSLLEPCKTWNPINSPDAEFQYIDISSVDRENKKITSTTLLKGQNSPSRARQIVKSGDVLVSTVRPNLNSVAQVGADLDGATASTGFTVLRPRSTLDSAFLFHWVKTPQFVDDMVKKATGANYPAVSDRIIFESKIPLPSITEQRRIAAILDKAEALRSKRREAIAKLDQLLQSVFLEMFGDPIVNPKGWKSKFISEICSLVRGSSPRPQGDSRYFGGPVPRLMVADITRDGWFVTPKIDTLTVEGAKKSRPTKKDTVVMAVSGNVGLAAMLMTDACIHDGFVAFNEMDSSIDSIYFLSILRSMKSVHVKATTGAIFKNTTTSDIKEIKIPIPPIDLQTKYSNLFKKIFLKQSMLKESELNLEKFTKAIQSNFFKTG